MDTKHKQLLHILLDSKTYVTSASLAKLLNVTSRTVKTYISNINAMSNSPVISSSKNGYIVIPDKALDLLKDEDIYLENIIDRAYYIIRKILIKQPYIDIYELCEEFYISESTLKSDIKKINIMFERFKVSFVIRGSRLTIEGNESDKRRLLSHTIFSEMSNKFVDIDILKSYFGEEMVRDAEQLIEKICNDHEFFINEYSSKILLQHILIAIDRARRMHEMEAPEKEKILTEKDKEVSNEITDYIREKFNINLNYADQYEILMLFKTSVNILTSDFDNYESFVDSKLLKIVNSIIEEIYVNFQIDLYDRNFLGSFLLHLTTFLERTNRGLSIRNPMLDVIKRDSPIVYDIAVYFMLKLKEYYDLSFYEDEIAYFALHIGAELTRQKNDQSKVKCVLLCPDYLDIHKNLVNSLLQLYGDDLSINRVISSPEKLPEEHFDLLISTVELEPTSEYKTFTISPLFEGESPDLAKLIRSIKEKTAYRRLADHFDELFFEDLFVIEKGDITPEEVIQLLCSKIQDKGFVQDDFYPDVLEREHISSTSFYQFAIPHSEKMNALQSCVSVLINKHGINWNGTIVHIVFLPSIAGYDKSMFRELYSVLIGLFKNIDMLETVKSITDFAQFKQIVLSALS